jgi:NTE family protein
VERVRFAETSEIEDPHLDSSYRPEAAVHEPVALVLSGGGMRGFAHLGVLRALESHGFRPDIVVGTSAGSIVGALYASHASVPEVERSLSVLQFRKLNDWAFPWIAYPGATMGLVKGCKLRRFLEAHLGERRIERFPIRFAAVATQLETGEASVFTAGDAARAVLASTALPGIVAPVEIGGRRYADGALVSPLPVKSALALGAQRTIAVDVLYPPEDASVHSIAGVVFQSFVISAQRLKRFESPLADVVIAPRLPRTPGQLGFADRERLVAAGEAAVEASIGALARIFASGAPDMRTNVIPWRSRFAK